MSYRVVMLKCPEPEDLGDPVVEHEAELDDYDDARLLAEQWQAAHRVRAGHSYVAVTVGAY